MNDEKWTVGEMLCRRAVEGSDQVVNLMENVSNASAWSTLRRFLVVSAIVVSWYFEPSIGQGSILRQLC